MQTTRLLRTSACLLISALLTACATSPYSQEGKARSDALLAAQINPARALLESDVEPRIIYVGFALHSQSRAFREDVALVESMVKKIDSSAISLKLGNPAFGQEADWPYATKENISATLSSVAQMARPQDKVIVLLTSHGSVGSLAVNASNQDYPSVKAEELAAALKPLNQLPTLVIVSACFSESLIDAVKSERRIVLTAASKDRASFGCNFYSKNTFFIEELFGKEWDEKLGLFKNFTVARTRVEEREKAMKIDPPSEPRYAIGSSMKLLSETPLKAWRTTPASK